MVIITLSICKETTTLACMPIIILPLSHQFTHTCNMHQTKCSLEGKLFTSLHKRDIVTSGDGHEAPAYATDTDSEVWFVLWNCPVEKIELRKGAAVLHQV